MLYEFKKNIPKGMGDPYAHIKSADELPETPFFQDTKQKRSAMFHNYRK